MKFSFFQFIKKISTHIFKRIASIHLKSKLELFHLCKVYLLKIQLCFINIFAEKLEFHLYIPGIQSSQFDLSMYKKNLSLHMNFLQLSIFLIINMIPFCLRVNKEGADKF